MGWTTKQHWPAYGTPVHSGQLEKRARQLRPRDANLNVADNLPRVKALAAKSASPTGLVCSCKTLLCTSVGC